MYFRYSVCLVFIICQITKSYSFENRIKSQNKSQTRLVFKIVGGNQVDIRDYPYTAQYGSACAAAIIHEQWALTAAHCNPLEYLLVGSTYANTGRNISVRFRYDHPSWYAAQKNHIFDYDFRLLRLNEPLDFRDKYTQPIAIAHPNDVVVGKQVVVTGWGETVEDGKSSDALRAVIVPIVSNEVCKRAPMLLYAVTPRMFCAGNKEGLKDACQGDAGGPAVANGRLLGTVSFGFGCAKGGLYGVYSNVAVVRDWIIKVTGVKFH